MRRMMPLLALSLLTFTDAGSAWGAEPADNARKKIVLIAGKKSHGPEGNRIHDYPWSVRLLKVMLDNSNIADRVRVEMHFDGWPEDQSTLEDADTIMIVSDGRDGDRFSPAPHQASDDRIAFVEKQMKRGCGIITFHFSTFAPDKYGQKMLAWGGGYFDWEENGKRKWYSAIRHMGGDTQVELPNAAHSVCRGIKPFMMKEEYYYNIRFEPNDPGLTHVLRVPSLGGRARDGNVVAWAKQRGEAFKNGRGFGTTCGHFYDNWKNDAFRKLILNAIAWTAHIDLPAGGVEASYYEHDQIKQALTGVQGTQPASIEPPIKALILTGHDGPFHPWRKKTPVLQRALEQDARFDVSVTTNIEDLAKIKPGDYDVLLLNYCNWERPGGLSDAAKQAFVAYLKAGGGLTIVHFSNGAWHRSLPKAEASDWPEFRKICRRVWNHKSNSAHDRYRKFTVEVTKVEHEITRGMAAWDTTDELYFNQAGDEPIVPLVSAVSEKTKKSEPLAWAYTYGKGRVFQTLLGHDDRSLMWGGTAQLIRRGTVWAAHRRQRAIGRHDISQAKPIDASTGD